MAQPGDPYDPNAAAQYPGQQPAPYQPPAAQPQQYGPPPGYPQPYPQPGYPAPGHAHPGYVQPGYPQQYPPPYPYAYAPPPGSGRPGNATAASVLGYVAAGLLIAAGLLLFLGASIIDDFDDVSGDSHSLVTAELVVDGLINLIAGGLLIGGAVSFGNRSSGGRIMLSVGSGIVIGESIYWLIRTEGGAVFWALVFAALVIISLALAWASSASNWLRAGT